MLHLAFLLFAGFVAGGMNAIAGGGTFVSMPALVAFGLAATQANASSTVALAPAALSGGWMHRHEIVAVSPLDRRTLVLVSIIGGSIGAGLLVATPTVVFDKVIAWLLLLACIFLWWGSEIRAALRRRGVHIGARGALVGQSLLSIYGGYFGGGVGIMMMAFWTMLSDLELKALTGPRLLITGLTNAAAVVFFIVAGAVAWTPTLIMLLGAALGGYAGARIGQRLPAPFVRAAVIAVTGVTTLAFFARAYF